MISWNIAASNDEQYFLFVFPFLNYEELLIHAFLNISDMFQWIFVIFLMFIFSNFGHWELLKVCSYFLLMHFISVFSAPDLKLAIFPKSSGSFQWEIIFRYLGKRSIYCYEVVIVFQGMVRKCVYIYIFFLTFPWFYFFNFNWKIISLYNFVIFYRNIYF